MRWTPQNLFWLTGSSSYKFMSTAKECTYRDKSTSVSGLDSMHHRRVIRLLMVTFSFTGSQGSLSSFELDFPKERRESKFPMVTTPFNFIILCFFFTSIQIKLLFWPKPKFHGEKDNSKPSAVNPAFSQKCRGLEFSRTWNARTLFASSIGHEFK